jgi:transcription factor SPN1
MKKAVASDLQSNKSNRPGLEKLKLLPTVLKKLKNKEFAGIFLDENGLDIINSFITILPDGSWPLSSVRSKIYDLIYKLPVQVDHLRATKLGRTLAILQNSKSEFPKNKKFIQMIKDKWSRIICTIPVDYTHLEQCERSYVNIPLYEKKEVESNERVNPLKFLNFLTFFRFWHKRE